MKAKHLLPLLILLLTLTNGYTQNDSFSWHLGFSMDINQPRFETTSAILKDKLMSNSSMGMGQSVGLGLGYTIYEKLDIRMSAQFKNLSYKNDSIGLDEVNLITKNFQGLEIPLMINYQFNEHGWGIGTGGLYYYGFQEQITYQLLNNNQIQKASIKSDAHGWGYQMELTRQFQPDNKHNIQIGIIGQHFPNLVKSENGQFGFMNLSLRLGLTFK
jgi:hypothetical protein